MHLPTKNRVAAEVRWRKQDLRTYQILGEQLGNCNSSRSPAKGLQVGQAGAMNVETAEETGSQRDQTKGSSRRSVNFSPPEAAARLNTLSHLQIVHPSTSLLPPHIAGGHLLDNPLTSSAQHPDCRLCPDQSCPCRRRWRCGHRPTGHELQSCRRPCLLRSWPTVAGCRELVVLFTSASSQSRLRLRTYGG